MEQIKIKIYVYGSLPFSVNWNKIRKWSSTIFQIIDITTAFDNKNIFTDKPNEKID